MFSTKSSMMMAFLALFLCVSSTVQAAELYNPGNPVNCTLWTQNCMTLGNSLYGTNSSYTSTSATCANQTTLTAAQDLCNYKVICLATFMTIGGGSTNAMINAALPSAAVTSPGAAASTSGAASAAPSASATSTTPAGPLPTGPVYGVGSVDITTQLLALYNTKCSGASAKIVTSAVAAAIVASILSIMSYAL